MLKAIESVIAQTFADFEIIVVNDGSTVDYNKVRLEFLRYDKIKYFYKANEERSVARNFAIEKSSGQFICFLDDDDLYLENHLEVLYNIIVTNEYKPGLYYTGAYQIIGDNLIRREPIGSCKNSLAELIKFVLENHLLINSVSLPKSILANYRFKEEQTQWEDINLWVRILLHYPVFEANEYTTICIEHVERSTSITFKDFNPASINKLLEAVKDLFSIAELERYYSKPLQRNFLFRKHINYAFNSIWLKKKKQALFFYKRAIQFQPSFLFSKQNLEFLFHLLK